MDLADELPLNFRIRLDFGKSRNYIGYRGWRTLSDHHKGRQKHRIKTKDRKPNGKDDCQHQERGHQEIRFWFQDGIQLVKGNDHRYSWLSFLFQATRHQKNASFYKIHFEELRDFKVWSCKAEASRFSSVDVECEGSRESNWFRA